MQVTRSILPDKNILYTTITGEITVAEVRADLLRLISNQYHEPTMPGIIDMRLATTKLTSDELQQIADFVASHPKLANSTRRALLVATDLMFGLYRMFAVYAANTPVEFRVFRDEKQAWAWIEEFIKLRKQN